VTLRRSADPLVPARLLRHRGVLPASMAIFLMMATYAGFLFSQTLFVQGTLGFSPLKAGIAFVPGALAFALAGLNWRRLPVVWQRWLVPAGLVLAGVGYVFLSPSGASGLFGVASTFDMLAIGVGLGVAFSPALAFGLRHVPLTEAGDAAGLLAMVTQLGQVIGVAAFGTLYFSAASPLPATGAALAITAVAAALAALRLQQPADLGHRG
jgi:hypothetical protein